MPILLSSLTLSNGYSQVICEGEKVMFPYSFNQCNNNEWVLVFEDEFNGNTLDLLTWVLRPWGAGALYGSGGPTQEYNTLDNITVENGNARIFALQETIVRRAIAYLPDSEVLSDGLPNLRPYYYTSSNIWSKKEFEFGRIEARIKIPKGKGLWPAFWLYGSDSQWNEVDIFEFWNEFVAGIYTPSLLSKVINMTVHYDYDGDGQTNLCHTKYTGDDFSEDFHIYALEWEPNKIAWYVDGNCLREDFRYYNLIGQPAGCNLSAFSYYTKNRIFPVNPMYIIFNLAIHNGVDNQPNDPTIFPAYMDVDWIRYYRRGSNNDLSITDPIMCPLNTVIYNSIIGNTISFNCPYIINNGNQLSAVASSEIALSSGFYVEEGGLFVAKINENISSKATNNTDELTTNKIEVLETVSSLPDISIYPTIGQGCINIGISSCYSLSELYVVVFDIAGNTILSQSLCGDNMYNINLPNSPNGLYVVQVIDSQGCVLKTEKVILSR